MEETRKQNGVTNIGGTDPTAVNREYKSDVFKMYFSIRKNALELYNALNGTDYTDEDALEINTLDQSVFLKIYNDVSFTISGTVNLYEHQSSVNPNMPLRDLFYVTDMFKSEIVNKDLHGKKLIKIPTPKFVVFYNGTGEMPDEEEQKPPKSECGHVDRSRRNACGGQLYQRPYHGGFSYQGKGRCDSNACAGFQ